MEGHSASVHGSATARNAQKRLTTAERNDNANAAAGADPTITKWAVSRWFYHRPKSHATVLVFGCVATSRPATTPAKSARECSANVATAATAETNAAKSGSSKTEADTNQSDPTTAATKPTTSSATAAASSWTTTTAGEACRSKSCANELYGPARSPSVNS